MSIAPVLPPEIVLPSARRPHGERPRGAGAALAARRACEAAPARPVPEEGPAEGPPREAVVIPFPAVRPSEPARPAAWPTARPRRVVRPAREPRAVGRGLPGQGSAPGLRLTRRGRVVVAAAMLLGVLAFGWMGTRLVHTQTTIPPSAPAVVEVQPGDTVWSIAERVAPAADTRAVVDAIVARNDLVGGVVHPGQHLVIHP
jgi:hypothetical protein